MKVEVLAEQLIYTDKENVRSDYVAGQVLEMDDEYVAQQIEAGNVKAASHGLNVSKPVESVVVKPAPAPPKPEAPKGPLMVEFVE